jgi:DNA-binding CsgD family transcriptional regulator
MWATCRLDVCHPSRTPALPPRRIYWAPQQTGVDMADLRISDCRALNDSVLTLYSDYRAETFPARLQRALSTLIPADITAVECFDAKAAWTGRMFADPAPLVERHFRAFLQERVSHPLFALFVAGQLWQPVRISDVLSLRTLRELAIYSEFLNPLGVDRQMAIASRRVDGSAAVLVVSRKGREFSGPEKARLAAFIPHVNAAERTADAIDQRQADSTTQHAGDLFARVAPSTLKASLTITEREAEIVWWLAHGKTDAEIATICGMSKRTVQKHCENVYRKLGVECRTAAVMRALERYT